MTRIIRLSVLALCSMALLPLGLAGCDGRPADGTQVQINEVERKQAIDKMRTVMETRKPARTGSKSH